MISPINQWFPVRSQWGCCMFPSFLQPLPINQINHVPDLARWPSQLKTFIFRLGILRPRFTPERRYWESLTFPKLTQTASNMSNLLPLDVRRVSPFPFLLDGWESSGSSKRLPIENREHVMCLESGYPWHAPFITPSIHHYPLVICYITLEDGPVESSWVFPLRVSIFHSYVRHYQRVIP